MADATLDRRAKFPAASAMTIKGEQSLCQPAQARVVVACAVVVTRRHQVTTNLCSGAALNIP